MGRALWRRGLIASLGVAAIGWSAPLAPDRGIELHGMDLARREHRVPRRPLVRGDEFPDGVFALTWDDGPDRNTLALARYLHERRVSATFFVVGEWIAGTSDEPGTGADAYRTGFLHLPILGELTALGHRLGNHTQNHVLLGDAPGEVVIDQLSRSKDAIDPFVRNELRLFRAPGGSWSSAADEATAEPSLPQMSGPVHWDVDAKDWDASLYCRSAPAEECEPSPIPGESRVRASVLTRRYVEQAIATRRGIILLHDRVGDVGSSYALDVATHLVPELQAHRFVLSAPVLAFATPTERLVNHAGRDADRTIFADVDGDGHADLCMLRGAALTCARASTARTSEGLPRTAFERPVVLATPPPGTYVIDLGDVDGDGRADVCALDERGIDCALTDARFSVGPFRRFLPELGALRSSRSSLQSFRLSDVDGDGRADACARTAVGIACAKSRGDRFDPPTVWLAASAEAGAPFALGDVDGDRRADVCLRSGRGVACALSTGGNFASASRWSEAGDLEGSGPLLLADLNGDGRADVCATTSDGLSCALSDGHGLKLSSRWSAERSANVRLADINGDGRADLCVVGDERTLCGLAP